MGGWCAHVCVCAGSTYTWVCAYMQVCVGVRIGVRTPKAAQPSTLHRAGEVRTATRRSALYSRISAHASRRRRRPGLRQDLLYVPPDPQGQAQVRTVSALRALVNPAVKLIYDVGVAYTTYKYSRTHNNHDRITRFSTLYRLRMRRFSLVARTCCCIVVVVLLLCTCYNYT